MKRVLITGKGSYIGTKVEAWLKKSGHEVYVLDMLGDEWKEYDFRGYDAVVHVAGIAHNKNASKELYEHVNHLLAVEVAKKAEKSGVSQFVFMSSGAVYSQSDKKHKVIFVNSETPLNPTTAYGISKMKAEKDIVSLDTNMNIVIIRPPMVYGPGAKGNYNALSKMVKKTFFFPRIYNQRSMIYIDNLCEFIRLVIEDGGGGVYLPQNKDYVIVSELVKKIAEYNNIKIHFTSMLNWLVYILGYILNSINKVFGTFCYDNSLICFNGDYQIVDFDESIRITESYLRGNDV